MTDQELIIYFENATLPAKLRLDRASTQYEVKDAVQRNIEMLKQGDKGDHAKHRLIQIMNAIEHPYDGPEIPRR
ncbi:hypothetical protein SAMN05216464_115117 [Mucilaginibacter pineti]|uniref:DUF6965 domain-containing protein n=1 Tax=Mucilaginibacter pineti TaxID=1391627 RepID=A0A1G7JU55_9SPHI|nr:hypothetical protein [Mucilaginibacter pineti]SDF28480.1 hypothetical protein SAMN05216464_115117 [Mucilaginibacter pineti]